MNKLLFNVFLLGTFNNLNAMNHNMLATPNLNGLMQKKIKVPAQTIYNRFCALHLKQFIDATDLHKTIGDKELYSIGFVVAVDNEIVTYLTDLRERSDNTQFVDECSLLLNKMRDPMIKTILQDHPEEIKKLIKENLLKQESHSYTRKPHNPWRIVQSFNQNEYDKQTLAWRMSDEKDFLWNIFIENK